MLPIPCLLVFDDCHRIRDDAPFFETLREGISRLAPGIGALLVSRSDPHPSFPYCFSQGSPLNRSSVFLPELVGNP